MDEGNIDQLTAINSRTISQITNIKYWFEISLNIHQSVIYCLQFFFEIYEAVDWLNFFIYIFIIFKIYLISFVYIYFKWYWRYNIWKGRFVKIIFVIFPNSSDFFKIFLWFFFHLIYCFEKNNIIWSN